jgi:hypothetical protein
MTRGKPDDGAAENAEVLFGLLVTTTVYDVIEGMIGPGLAVDVRGATVMSTRLEEPLKTLDLVAEPSRSRTHRPLPRRARSHG